MWGLNLQLKRFLSLQSYLLLRHFTLAIVTPAAAAKLTNAGYPAKILLYPS
jgi:hypothetical protein